MYGYTDEIYNLPGFFLFNPPYNLNSKIPLISFQTRRAGLISEMKRLSRKRSSSSVAGDAGMTPGAHFDLSFPKILTTKLVNSYVNLNTYYKSSRSLLPQTMFPFTTSMTIRKFLFGFEYNFPFPIIWS